MRIKMAWGFWRNKKAPPLYESSTEETGSEDSHHQSIYCKDALQISISGPKW